MNQLLMESIKAQITQAELALKQIQHHRLFYKVALHQERLITGKRINEAKENSAGFALA